MARGVHRRRARRGRRSVDRGARPEDRGRHQRRPRDAPARRDRDGREGARGRPSRRLIGDQMNEAEKAAQVTLSDGYAALRDKHLAEMADWVEGRRSWTNLGPHEPYTPDVI